jgi:hypothetical protein
MDASKSYFAARSLRNDLKSYIKLNMSGDYSVDEILSWYDLSFIPERFGCEEWELFTSILCSIGAHIERKRKDLFIKGFGWLGFRQVKSAAGWGNASSPCPELYCPQPRLLSISRHSHYNIAARPSYNPSALPASQRSHDHHPRAQRLHQQP